MGTIYARRIIEDRGINDPAEIDLEDIAESLEVTIQHADLEGCDGVLQVFPDPKCGLITVRSSIKEEGQKRFTIAHELGHYEIPGQPNQDYHCGPAEISPMRHRIRPEEVAANEFAAELLMPEKLFRTRMQTRRPSIDWIRSLASDFQTTLTATLRRFVAFTDYRCAMVSSVDGKVEYFKPSNSFRHKIKKGVPLHPDSWAIDFFKGSRIKDKMVSVPAYAWIKSDRISKKACIFEHSIAQPSYNSVLTFLWISQNIDGLSSK